MPHGKHMVETMISDESEMPKMGRKYSNILDNFTKLKDNNSSVRLNSGLALLNHIRHITDQNDKELDFTLDKMVARLGSSLTSTRIGFYSTLTAFLTIYPDTAVEKLLSIMNTQLRPAGSNLKSENADIYMGHILLCGAMIRSNLLAQNSIEFQQQIMEILLNAGKQRSYLSFISTMFLSEFITQLDIESIKNVWPIVEKEIGKPWSEQTLDTFYVLLILRDKHPLLVNHKFLKQHLGITEIIAKESIDDIVKLLTALLRIISYQHPVYKLFCEKLVTTEFVADFWKGVDQKFIKPSRSDEYVAVEMLRLILVNITDKTIIPVLLSPNLLQHMLKRFSNCKKNTNDEVLMAFRKVLHLIVSATNDKDMKTKIQFSILKKFILHPGDLMIEKKTGIKVIQVIMGNLRIDGIKKLSKFYREIIENKTTKEREGTKTEFWTNAERSYVAQLLTKLMGRPETFLDEDWRLEQLIFLFNYGFCEVSDVGIELAPQFKDSFYRALDYKLPKLDNARNLLSALVHNLDSKLQSNVIRLRLPLNDAATDAWKRVIDLIKKLEKNTKNSEALPIFHTMNLHMGLQLFSDPEMAIMSINELQCCYERLNKKSKKHKKLNNTDMEEEPEWVEVVVDLLLSFLSKNDHLFRSLVGCVFPHICPYLTPSAVHQILAVLDIKNTQKTLTMKKQNDDDSSDTESESEDNEEHNEEDEEEDEEEESVSNDEVLSESESESENEDENEDETVTDKLRIALHQALGDAAMKTDDEDIDALIEKGERSASVCQELNDKLAECCTFLVRCAQQANLVTKSIVEIYGENLTAFFKKRDCVLSPMLFKGVLQLCWEDNWQLALLLVDFTFDSSIRYFRRNQALELLLIFYNNNRLLNMSTKYTNVRMELEATLCKNTINTLQETSDLHLSNGQSTLCSNVNSQKKVSQKFIGHLLILLRVVHTRCLSKAWNWQTVKTALINYRSQNSLFGDTKTAYNKLATEIGVPLNVLSKKENAKLDSSSDTDEIPQNNGKQSNIGSQNGKTSESEEEKEEEESKEVSHSDNEQTKKKKNKRKQREKQLLKKEARELRAQVMSQDIEPFKFSSVNLPENDDVVELFQNGDLHDNSTNLKAPQKRNQSLEDNPESKRRKRVSHA
ncbi:Myb-binding protein 1A [Cyphomyrmex costatus]|uniref:Myb-binding protein 1A n=1 Tax=Cyphomyrmex costatus TaxID=456900 RepID=A0A151IFU4_9HYME|nr:Myb-binding protein 1A [Cyphomyrmex costatus]